MAIFHGYFDINRGYPWSIPPCDRGEGEASFASTEFQREASPKSWEDEALTAADGAGWDGIFM
jgi:hypothetical protein